MDHVSFFVCHPSEGAMNNSEDLKVSILYLITEIEVGLILDSANVEIAKEIWKSHASCHILL